MRRYLGWLLLVVVVLAIIVMACVIHWPPATDGSAVVTSFG